MCIRDRYNVNGEGSRRFVGEVEVGGWPVPDVTWYKVMEDGEEVEVKTKTHTENWNGFPNKYVPDSRVEVKRIDDIRHCIIFHRFTIDIFSSVLYCHCHCRFPLLCCNCRVSEGDSGLYRVRAVNSLGQAECEADLYFDGCGTEDGMYLSLIHI